ncbi:hypothetical protein [Halocynthiibacter sp.]|uniref:hypothetical protein n=1 Tax=Halocynthiibacter sp. TaxID=1979210 RepID=UPI003C56C0E6
MPKHHKTTNRQTPPDGNKRRSPIGLLTGQLTPMSKVFCQESLTKTTSWVENKDNITPQKMGAFNRLAQAAALSAGLTGAAEAQEQQGTVVLAATTETTTQVTDCVGFVREQRDLARDTGIALSRSDQKTLLHECRNGELADRLAEQEAILADLRIRFNEIVEQSEDLQITMNANAQIIDENNTVIAQIVAINGQWVIQRQLENQIEQSQERQQAMLDEADRILANYLKESIS